MNEFILEGYNLFIVALVDALIVFVLTVLLSMYVVVALTLIISVNSIIVSIIIVFFIFRSASH